LAPNDNEHSLKKEALENVLQNLHQERLHKM